MTTTRQGPDGAPADAPGTGPADRPTRGPRASGSGRAVPGAWLLRIVRHRAGAQWRLLAVTAAVALLVSTLVSTLALVLDLAEGRGVGQALTDAPDRARLTVSLAKLGAPVSEVAEGTAAGLEKLLQVPVTSRVTATSEPYGLDRPSGPDWLLYLDRRDTVQDSAELLAGSWPEPWTGGDAPIPVAIPAVGATAMGVEVGDAFELLDRRAPENDLTVRVAGIYQDAFPARTEWARDRLGGWGYSPSFPVPGSAGMQMTEAIGPLIVSAETMDRAAILVQRAYVHVDPDLTAVRASRLPALRTAAATLADELGFEIDELAGSTEVTGSLRYLVDETTTGVVVTRAGVAVSAATLLMVAFAALLQTARLVSDARSAEHDLMRARGASRGHLVAALVVETGVLGVLVAAVGPVLAPQLMRAVGGPLADGVPADLAEAVRALPGTSWAAGVVVAVMLVAATLVPLIGAPATFVEGQQARGRAPWIGSLARLAADVAVVALAVGAWTQLRSYQGLLVGSGTGLAVDPVLVVGPALLLLAAVLIGVRVLTYVTRLAERGAARGRGVVLPLAGWELGRRPRQAATAVLLLSIALGAATFGLTQSATWEQSQRDQAEFAVGAPAVVLDDGTPGADAAVLRAAGVTPEPVGRMNAHVGTRLRGTADLNEGFSGTTSRLLAPSGPARAMLDHGRVGTEGGAAIAALPTQEPTSGGIDLGEQVIGLAAEIEITCCTMPEGLKVILRGVLEDATGVLSTVELGMYDLRPGEHEVAKLLPEVRLPAVTDPQESADRLAAAAAARAYPLRLVGLQAIMAEDDGIVSSWGEPYDATVAVTELSVLRPAADVDAVDPEDWVQHERLDGPEVGIVKEPVELGPGEWSITGHGLTGDFEPPTDSPLWVRLLGVAQSFRAQPAMGAVVAWEPVGEVPAVVSAPLMAMMEPDTELISIKLDGVVLRGVVADVVDRVPTTTAPLAVAVDRTTVSRALIEAGADATLVDEWWVDVPDAQAWAAALPEDASGRSLAARTETTAGTAQELLEHPLRSANQVVLGLLALGGALIATVGFAVHTAVSVRGRGLELAQLRAVGLTRGRLTTVLGLEVAALAVLGVLLGLGAGTVVVGQVTSLLVSGADGAAPIPAVVLEPARGLGWVAAAVLVVVAVLATGIAAAQRAANPAALLREGEAR